MREKIIIAGSGGQGIMLLGKVLAESALRENKEVTWFPCYGAEVRGGSAYCMVVIASEFIASPYVEKPDTLILMNEPSLERFKGWINKKSVVLLNSSLIKNNSFSNGKIFSLPFTENALKLGNIKIANMIALGSYLKIKPTVSVNKVYEVIDMAPVDKEIKELNKRALQLGMKMTSGFRKSF